jgi:peptidoglycan/xylan/chitin deacetylase (PgdA/CDA1 family)
MTENLKKLVTIEARDTFPGIKKENALRMLVTNSGIRAYFKTDEGEKETEVPFSKLRAFVPASLCKDEGGRYIDITKKMVAITFDDGPHNTYSNKILDTLEKHNSVATFFEVGNLVSQGADTIKRADALGCEIASHTWSHANLQTSSQSVIDSQIEKADEAFYEAIGKKPALLRPPYGATDKELLANCDKYLIGWSVDTNDWKYRDADKVFSVIKNEGDLDGDVILMHSLYDSTAKATERIVPYLVDKGYQLVTISELIKYKNEDFLETGKYYTYNYFG